MRRGTEGFAAMNLLCTTFADSVYRPIERAPRRFNPIHVPKSLQVFGAPVPLAPPRPAYPACGRLVPLCLQCTHFVLLSLCPPSPPLSFPTSSRLVPLRLHPLCPALFVPILASFVFARFVPPDSCPSCPPLSARTLSCSIFAHLGLPSPCHFVQLCLCPAWPPLSARTLFCSIWAHIGLLVCGTLSRCVCAQLVPLYLRTRCPALSVHTLASLVCATLSAVCTADSTSCQTCCHWYVPTVFRLAHGHLAPICLCLLCPASASKPICSMWKSPPEFALVSTFLTTTSAGRALKVEEGESQGKI